MLERVSLKFKPRAEVRSNPNLHTIRYKGGIHQLFYAPDQNYLDIKREELKRYQLTTEIRILEDLIDLHLGISESAEHLKLATLETVRNSMYKEFRRRHGKERILETDIEKPITIPIREFFLKRHPDLFASYK